MRAGDQKLRFDLVWPNYQLEWPYSSRDKMISTDELIRLWFR